MKKKAFYVLIILTLLLGCSNPGDSNDKYSLSITISPSGTGTVTKNPDDDSYEDGTIVELTAHPNLGHLLSGWSGDASGSSTSISIQMDSDKTVVASFEEGVYEDFNDGIADYFSTDGSGRWSVSSGRYYMTGYSGATWAYSYYPYSFTNFAFSVDVRKISGSLTIACGIYFKSQGVNPQINAYRIAIDSTGWWYFGLSVNGVFTNITGWIESDDLFLGMNVVNNIGVIFSGSNIDIYFNNQYQGFISNAITWPNGRQGVNGYDTNSAANIYVYDNFIITPDAVTLNLNTIPQRNSDLNLENMQGEIMSPDDRSLPYK